METTHGKFNYEKLGFKSGLEIHQQLDTEKLFSRTPSLLRNDLPDYSIKRKLHIIAGESGEIDEAVLHEASFDREFYYEGYNDSISLVELDESPPERINDEALKITLQIALLLNCEILPVSQIMRKIVIDGSNTSGFQRTVLIAKNGFIKTSFGKVEIETVVLEEDSARLVSKEDKKTIYRLDRLGIPLIEISTYPYLKNPEQVKESALRLGDILRACKVRRGIGTIRQDINISISNHPRVEIKGFQDAKMFIKTIENEVERQIQNLKSKKAISEVRNALPDGSTEFLRPMPGSSRMYPETDLPLLFISRDMINEAKKTIPKLREDIKNELKTKGLGEEMIKLVIKENKIDEIKALSNITNDIELIAKMLVLWPKDFAKKLKKDMKIIEQILNLDVLEGVLKSLRDGLITKHNIQDILFEIVQGKTLEEILKKEKASIDEVENFIRKLIKEKPGLSISGYMGIIVNEFKGKISGKEISEILKKYLK
ncbi:MAG: Glu-tRNA(Gln) amidotransferase subunit GatE [Candidatus Pacearchaeota archaeon]